MSKPALIAGDRSTRCHADDIATARYHDIRIESHFQPIFSTSQRQIVGYEALLRGRGARGETIPPIDLFETCSNLDEKIHLDRLSRALHVARFQASGLKQGWLFVNVTPEALQADKKRIGSSFGPLLEHFGVPPNRVVVEILECATADLTALQNAVAYYKRLGCLVAVDDFGVDASDIRRIWQLSPHIVKLDRHIIVAASQQMKAWNALLGLVELLHEVGSLAVIEGVETAEQLQVAVDANADLVQGYYLARPGSDLPVAPMAKGAALERLEQAFSSWRSSRATVIANTGKCAQMLISAAAAIGNGIAPADACEPLFSSGFAHRVYIADAEGRIMAICEARQSVAGNPQLFEPIIEQLGADISRRHQVSAAICNPGHVQIGRPVTSTSHPGLCLPITLALHVDGQLRVLLCELPLCNLIYRSADSAH